MLKNLRVGWRQFVADPGYTAVVVGGLAVAIASCFLVAQIVFNEVLPDPDVPDPGQVVTLEFHQDVWREQAPFVLAGALRQANAPASAIARSLDGHSYAVHAGSRNVRLGLVFADPDIVDIFGLRSIAGDLRATLKRPDGIALTEASARKLFPDGDALGKTVVVHGHALTVLAVVSERPRLFQNASDAFASFDSPASDIGPDTRTDWNWTQGNVFARVAPGFRPADLGAAAQAVYEKGPGRTMMATERKQVLAHDDVRATPLPRQYLHGAEGHGHAMQLLGIAGGAALMLALALANHVNLTSVRTLARAREIAVRKTLGADPWRLTLQFVLESALTAALSAAIGLLIAWWLAPTIGELLYLHLARGLFAPGRLALLAAATLALGAVGGLYPARIALGVNCVAALAGRSHAEGAAGRAARRVMTGLQFAVALVIAGGAGAMLWQNRYIASLPPGIDTHGLLAVDIPDAFFAFGGSPPNSIAFRDAVSHEPGVEATAWSMDVPGRSMDKAYQTVSRGAGSPLLNANVMPVDVGFFDLYGVHLAAGRPRAPASAAPAASAASAPPAERLVVVDATTTRQLGFATPESAVDQLVFGGGDYGKPGKDPWRIVAVASDVRLEDAREEARPHVFAITLKPQAVLTLKGRDMALLQQAVARVWPRFYPDDALDPQTADEAVAQPYEREHAFARVAAGTTIIALLLSAFGVYALAAYTVRRSAREIVVRKLYGAGRGRIARLVAQEFAPLLAAAAVVGLPLAGWLAHAWQDNFTARSPGILWVLPAALLALLATTLLAALRHARLAMAMRPAQALRD
jgi:putative ABC transport system permease protein